MGLIYNAATWVYNKSKLKEVPFLNMLRFEHTYRFNGGWGNMKHHEKEADDFIRKHKLKEKNYKSALDVGCGYGVLCRKMSKFIPIVVGIDISPTALKVAAQDNKAIILRRSIVDFCSGKYDVIISNGVLDYLTESQREKAMENIKEMQGKDLIIEELVK